MAGERLRYGPLVSTLGGILLAVSVFLPWYGISFTASGIALAQQFGDQVASQLGSPVLQSYTNALHSNLSGLAGHEFFALSAHQALHDLNVVLLIAAGLAIAIALLELAGSRSGAFENSRGALALIGAVATVGVLYRIVDPPAVPEDVFALSLREGAWLALLGSAAIIAGALWPSSGDSRSASETHIESGLASLSGWTPEA